LAFAFVEGKRFRDGNLIRAETGVAAPQRAVSECGCHPAAGVGKVAGKVGQQGGRIAG
jgi:hypothetical protein